MIFQGEEINIGLRGFTYGYDYYAPERSVLFHYYSHGGKDKKVKTFWEHSSDYSGLEQASMARLLGISDLLPTQKSLDEHKKYTTQVEEEEEVESFDLLTTTDPIEWNAIEERKYGLGKVRSVSKFLATFGINIFTQKVQHHMCRFVGKPMNRLFLKHLRKNGMGIDYDEISFEFKDPVEYGQTWEGETADDQGVQEEEAEEEAEGGEEEEGEVKAEEENGGGEKEEETGEGEVEVEEEAENRERENKLDRAREEMKNKLEKEMEERRKEMEERRNEREKEREERKRQKREKERREKAEEVKKRN